MLRLKIDGNVCDVDVMDPKFRDAEGNFNDMVFSPEMFLNKEEILEDLKSLISEEDNQWLRDMGKDRLISTHHSLGRYIRNTYGLWFRSNPFTDNDDGDSPLHADNYSFDIIKEYHARLSRT